MANPYFIKQPNAKRKRSEIRAERQRNSSRSNLKKYWEWLWEWYENL